MCDGKTVFFLDMERIFKELSPDSLIGNQLIFEHLHPNARGYFLMAKAMVQSMREHALFASAAEWNSIPAPDEDSLWRQRKVSSFDDRLALRKVEILTAAWPFSNQTVPVVSSIGQDDTLGIIVESITRNRSNWVTAHQKSADFFHRRKDFVSAAKEYETVIAMFPHDVQHYLKAGRIYLDMGDLDKVKKIMTTSLQLKKTMLAYRVLGDIALREKRPEDAIQFYRDLTSFDQNLKERLENGYFLALAYSQSGKTEQARTQLLSLLQLQPDFTPAAVLLSNLQKK
jgi:tetratricopeptide (TPR) repeat protein